MIIIPMGGGTKETFASLRDIGKHYANMADALSRSKDPDVRARGLTYSLVAWQLQNATEEPSEKGAEHV